MFNDNGKNNTILCTFVFKCAYHIIKSCLVTKNTKSQLLYFPITSVYFRY